MGKGKLAKFADMASYPHVFEYPYSVVDEVPFDMKGRWHEDFFRNDHPIVLELGCGRGEYTVGLARLYPDKNFIGVDIKGARMWTGATEALREGLSNVAFFAHEHRDYRPFLCRRRSGRDLADVQRPADEEGDQTSDLHFFMTRYRRFLQDRGRIHLKTDSTSFSLIRSIWWRGTVCPWSFPPAACITVRGLSIRTPKKPVS